MKKLFIVLILILGFFLEGFTEEFLREQTNIEERYFDKDTESERDKEIRYIKVKDDLKIKEKYFEKDLEAKKNFKKAKTFYSLGNFNEAKRALKEALKNTSNPQLKKEMKDFLKEIKKTEAQNRKTKKEEARKKALEEKQKRKLEILKKKEEKRFKKQLQQKRKDKKSRQRKNIRRSRIKKPIKFFNLSS